MFTRSFAIGVSWSRLPSCPLSDSSQSHPSAPNPIMKTTPPLHLKKPAALLLSLASFGLSHLAFAQTWSGANLADWNTGTNWSGSAVPSGATVTINNSTTSFISATAPTLTTNSINVLNAGSGFSVRAGGSLTGNQLTLSSGSNGTSVAGGSLTLNANLGNNATTATMAVSSGTVDFKSVLQVGSTATATTTARGTLTISGGTVTQSSTSHSLHLGRGKASAGTLNITGGTVELRNTQTANFGQTARIGGEGGTGIINQSAGTLTSAGSMVFGHNTNSGTTGVNGGSGTLNLSGGSFSSSGTLMLGNSTGTSGTINFSGGSFTASGIRNGAGTARVSVEGNAGGSSFSSNSIVLTSGASLAFNIDKNLGINTIQINGAGTAASIASFSSTLFEFNTVGAFTEADIGQTFNLVHWTNGMMSVTGSALSNLGSTSFGNLQVVSDGGTGSFLQATLLTSSAIPEPSSYAAILGVFIGGCVLMRRRRSQSV